MFTKCLLNNALNLTYYLYYSFMLLTQFFRDNHFKKDRLL